MVQTDTMGYDPFPASFLPQLIKIAGFWKHDLTGNFNYDCSVSPLLASFSYKDQPVPPGAPYELPDPQHTTAAPETSTLKTLLFHPSIQ